MGFLDRIIAGEARQLNKQSRAGLPGRFVKLEDGVTHYDDQGPENGRSPLGEI